jgi:hypothetical protein
MRDTTKIMATAQEGLADLEAAKDGNVVQLREATEAVKSNLREIVSIARRMDARTGTVDPSAKKAGT